MPKTKKFSPNYLPHEKHHYKVLILVGLLGLWLILELLGFGVFNRSAQNDSVETSSLPTSQTKTFTASSVMGGFTIEVPEGFEVEEKNTIITLKKNDNYIDIFKTSTNKTSLKDVFNSDQELNKRVITYKTINNLDAGYEISQTAATYYFYIPWRLYSLVTSSESLYQTLDQIAQSFRVPEN